MITELIKKADYVHSKYLEAVKRNGGYEGSSLCHYYLAQLDLLTDILYDEFNYTYLYDRVRR